jgi:hypothetical protein
MMHPESVQTSENRRIGGCREPEIAPFGSFPPGSPVAAEHHMLRERPISPAC